MAAPASSGRIVQCTSIFLQTSQKASTLMWQVITTSAFLTPISSIGATPSDEICPWYLPRVRTYKGCPHHSCLGWRGVCVEPNPIYHSELIARRSCELVPTCASEYAENATLVLPAQPWLGGLGGISGGKLGAYKFSIKNSSFKTVGIE